MVALYESGLVTDCPRGENKGRVLSNEYVVRKLEKLCTVKDISAKKTVSGTVNFALWEGFNGSKCGVAVFVEDNSHQIFGSQSIQLPDTIWYVQIESTTLCWLWSTSGFCVQFVLDNNNFVSTCFIIRSFSRFDGINYFIDIFVCVGKRKIWNKLIALYDFLGIELLSSSCRSVLSIIASNIPFVFTLLIFMKTVRSWNIAFNSISWSRNHRISNVKFAMNSKHNIYF